jgi:hypothetical protein
MFVDGLLCKTQVALPHASAIIVGLTVGAGPRAIGAGITLLGTCGYLMIGFYTAVTKN